MNFPMNEVASQLEYEEIKVGSSYSFSRTISESDVADFARLSGDFNPLHVNEDFASNTQFGRPVVHGMMTASLLSTLVGMYCPGEKGLYLSQTLQFKAPLYYGDSVIVIGTVMNKVDALRLVKIKTEIYRDEDLIVTGEAQVRMIEKEVGNE